VIHLNQIGALPIPRLPVELEHVRDLEEFDGPLLSEFRSADGEVFIYSWCDCDEEVNRWIVVRTPLQTLFRYLVGRSTLRELVRDCRDRFVYIVDLDQQAEARATWFITAESLPIQYLPGPASYHPRDSSTEPGYQDVYINQKWDDAYPRKYLQAYAFHTAFGAGGNPGNLKITYNLTTGWIFHTLFDIMQKNAPLDKRGDLAAVGFASPGYIRFSVDSEIAAGLRTAVSRYLAQRNRIRTLLDKLSTESRGEIDEGDNELRGVFSEICRRLGVADDSLLAHSENLQAAARVLVGYVRRIEFLGNNEKSRLAMLVGLTADGE
jgi:hypothetical protein